jgi:hypothetical protein
MMTIMMYSLLSAATLTLMLAAAPGGGPGPAKSAKGLPPNTIDCSDWTRNSDGSWTAHHNAKPFDVGDSRQMSVQDSRIGPKTINAGGYDLTDLLDEKCGTI